MIPVKDTFQQIDSLPGEEIAFGIGDPRWVMRTQAELYSDVTTAIIREYSTNAHDANVMAGNADPIQVTLPSIMNPFFVVEDKGVGMSIEIFRSVYTQFGVSDKRSRNDANGMLGYGSKSGVAYTTSFQVESVRDGMKIHGVVMRKPDWTIVLKIVSTVKTDEPNGTKITIPVHNVDEFNHKAKEFYKYWLPGRVEVNGQPMNHHVGEKIVDGLYYSEDWNESRIVMGNVAYRINNPQALFYNTKMNHINFVAYVDNGQVEFTPSREDLAYTEHTKATLQKVVHDFEREIVDAAKKDISEATTHAEAYAAWSKWTTRLGRVMFNDLEFKGDKFVSDFNVKGDRYQPSAYRGNMVVAINKWNVEAMNKTVFVTEFDVIVSYRHKEMVKEYAKQQGWDFNYAVFTRQKADDIVCPWITKDRFITYEALRKAVPTVRKQPGSSNRYNPNAGRIPGSWDYFTSKGSETQKPLPDGNKSEILWISLQNAKAYDICGILKKAAKHDVVVIEVPGNRQDKFLRENPTVKSFIDTLKSWVVLDGSSLLCDEGKRVMAIDYTTRRWLESLDISKIDDPEVHQMKAAIKNESALTEKYNNAKTLAMMAKMGYNFKSYEPKEHYEVNKKYPLLSGMSLYGKRHPHVYLYMNAVYSAESENKNV